MHPVFKDIYPQFQFVLLGFCLPKAKPTLCFSLKAMQGQPALHWEIIDPNRWQCQALGNSNKYLISRAPSTQLCRVKYNFPPRGWQFLSMKDNEDTCYYGMTIPPAKFPWPHHYFRDVIEQIKLFKFYFLQPGLQNTLCVPPSGMLLSTKPLSLCQSRLEALVAQGRWAHNPLLSQSLMAPFFASFIPDFLWHGRPHRSPSWINPYTRRKSNSICSCTR